MNWPGLLYYNDVNKSNIKLALIKNKNSYINIHPTNIYIYIYIYLYKDVYI